MVIVCMREDAEVVDVGEPERVWRIVSLLRDDEEVGEVEEGRREKKRMVG